MLRDKYSWKEEIWKLLEVSLDTETKWTKMKLRKERALFFHFLSFLVLLVFFNSVYVLIPTAAISIASAPVCIPHPPPLQQGRCLVGTAMKFPTISDSVHFCKINQVSRDFLIVRFIIER